MKFEEMKMLKHIPHITTIMVTKKNTIEIKRHISSKICNGITFLCQKQNRMVMRTQEEV